MVQGAQQVALSQCLPGKKIKNPDAMPKPNVSASFGSQSFGSLFGAQGL